MKTIPVIQKEIKSTMSEMEDIKSSEMPADKRAFKKFKKRLQYLKVILLYLETKPSEEFCRSEKEKLNTRIDVIIKRYEEPKNLTRTLATQHFKKYQKDNGVVKMKSQLTNLNFILK